MADNSVVDHDAAGLIAMGMAVVAHINACQQAGNAIRGQIETASDPFTVDLDAGYP